MGDTVNQVFLLAALAAARSRPTRAPVRLRHGALLLVAARGRRHLRAGRRFSAYEGIHALITQPVEELLVAYVVLGVSFLFEGRPGQGAAAAAPRRRRASGRAFRHVYTTPDPAVRAVAFEDSAALVGLCSPPPGSPWTRDRRRHLGRPRLPGDRRAAGRGRGLAGLVQQAQPDRRGAAAGPARGHHRGDPGDPRRRRGPGADDHAAPPDEVLVAARVDVDHPAPGETSSGGRRGRRRIREAYPEVRHVFLDPTTAGARAGR